MPKIKIYTVDYCPYCKRAVEFFKNNNLEFEQIKIDDNEDEMRKKLGEKYSIKDDVTVPQIEINGVHIGGYSDMINLIEHNKLKFD